MDDGEIVVEPHDLDLFLKTFDVEAERSRASRGSRSAGNDIKSVARLFDPQHLLEKFDYE